MSCCRQRRRILVGLFLVCWAPVTPAFALRDVICVGDCNYDRTAGVNELVTGVSITLGRQMVDACVAFDLSGDEQVSIDELIGGVRNALEGCPAARFEPAACDFKLPDGQNQDTVECGHLIAPEDRSRTDGRTVRLAIAVLKATDETPASDPFVYLSGGPGGPSLELSMQLYTPEFAAPLQSKRDLVFFDQRGTGRSQPKLNCPEYVETLFAAYAMNLTAEDDAAATLSGLRACHDRLVGEGINLSAYTSADSAADLQDLMTALAYEQWNIYGVSYGSRLALTALRDTPEHIRSVILDSTVPVDEPLAANWAADFEHALNAFFAGCAAEPFCSATYPDLEQTFFALLDRLDATPVTLHPIDPATGEAFDVVLSGDRLLLYIQQTMYRTDQLPLLPLIMAVTAQGSYGLLTAGYAGWPQGVASTAWGQTFSVLCGERIPFLTPEVVAQATAGVRPRIRDFGLTWITQFDLDVCDFWEVPPPAAIENEPVASDIPTLILAGEYDPITPPYYAAEAAQTLSRSHVFEFRGFGHAELRAQSLETARPRCAMQMVSAFLDDPLSAPDAGCLETLPNPFAS